MFVRSFLVFRLLVALAAWCFVLQSAECGAAVNATGGSALSETNAAGAQARVLVLNSYHDGYVWSDSILEGIRSVLDQKHASPELYVEYLDSKRNNVNVAFAAMYDLLREKYRFVKFDVVIVSDDNALTFVHAYRDELFPGAPVVFAGINDFRPERINKPWLTGVIEKQDTFGTIDLALKLDPSRNQFYVLSDNTITGEAMLDSFMDSAALFADHADFHTLVALPLVELQRQLAALPENAAVVYLSYYKTVDGQIFTLSESINVVLAASSAPVYAVAPHYMKTGVIGGVMLSSKKQGEVAGSMARRILAGESVASLPVIFDSPNIVTLDYNVMQRFGYGLDRIPEDVQVSNRPYSLWVERKYFVLGVLALGALQFAIILSLVVNVRRRERAEQEAKGARDLLWDIINSMPSVLLYTDRNGVVVSMNATAVRVCGLSSPEAEGKSLYELFPFLSRQSEHIEKAIAQGQSMRLQRVNVLIEGRPSYYDIETFPLSQMSGGGGAVVRLEDVSERVQMEGVIIQTEKMLSLGGLAAGMAHEINNPLGGILQGAQNIERRVALDLPANIIVAEKVGCRLQEVRAYLEERGILRLLQGIRESGVRAAGIVTHMLDFSRGEVSRRTLVDMARVTESALELARSDYDLKNNYDFIQVQCTVDIAPDMPLVPCCSTEMEQVLFNLIKNAAQAMATLDRPCSEGTLHIRVYVEGDMAVIEVEDNGPGLDAVTRSRVFEPFFTTKGPRLGTGLGLSVAYFIITRNHGGTFTVESEPGAGARFIISLPLEDTVEENVSPVFNV